MSVTTRRYEEWARKHLDIVNVTGDEAMVRCVVHSDSKASMQFNLRSGLWVCFACHEGGSIKRLCKELGIGLMEDPEPDVRDIMKRIKELSGDLPNKALKGQDEKTLKRYSLPTGYWTGRGFTKKTIKAFDLGLDMMADAVTIPLRDDQGRLLGVIKRYLGEDVELRYRYPKGFKRSLNLFASWLVEHHDTDMVVLCEGAVDAMMCWQAGIPALAIYGSSISPTQVRLLRRLGVGQVVLFFDDDKAGREARDCCLGIRHHVRKEKKVQDYDARTDLRKWFLVYDVRYREGWGSDPGSLSDKQIKKAVRTRNLLNLPANTR